MSKRLRITPNEMTCTGCGETALLVGAEWGRRRVYRCPRCADEDSDDAGAPPLVPTVSYLRPGEYEVMR